MGTYVNKMRNWTPEDKVLNHIQYDERLPTTTLCGLPITRDNFDELLAQGKLPSWCEVCIENDG